MRRYFQLDIADKKYRSVLLLSYSTIAVLTIIILLGGIFSWFNTHTRAVIYDMSMEQLKNLDTVVANTLDMYRIQLQTAWQDSGVKEYFYTGEESWENEYLVGNYFYKMCVNNRTADYVCLFREGQYQYYGPHYPEEQEKRQIEELIPKTENDTQQFLIETDSGKNLCIFLTERSAVGAEPDKGIVYSLNLSEMERQMISQENEDSVFLVFSDDGQEMMTGKLDAGRLDRVREQLMKDGRGKRNQEMVLDGRKYLYNSLYQEEIGMRFVLLQDYQVLQAQMNGIWKVAVACVIVSLLAALILAVFLTNRLYYPLEEFFERLHLGEASVGEGEYSRRQAEMTSERIISQIHMMSQQYHSDEVLSFLNGDGGMEIPMALKLSDRNEEARFLLFWTQKRVLERACMERIRGLLTENFSGCKLTAFQEPCSPWILICLKDPVRIGALEKEGWFGERIDQVCRQFAEEKGVQLYYAVSGLLREETEIRPAFQELQTLQKYHLLGQSGQGMRAEPFAKREKMEIPSRIYGEYLNAVKKGDAEEAKKQLPGILKQLSGFEIHKVLLSLAGFCVSLEQSSWEQEQGGRQRQEKFLEHYIRLSSLYDLSELEEYLGRLTEEACLENSVFQEKTLRMNLLDAVEYIREHYREDAISVEQVADRFHMSVSYFSKLFHEYTGMTFPEFINDLRLTYAKELLLSDRDLNVKRVAQLCGFGTTSYFSQQFKKKFGISPSTVRNIREK